MTLDEKRWQHKLARKRKVRGGKRTRFSREELKLMSDSAAPPADAAAPNQVMLLSYEITDEPMPDAAYARLPEKVQTQLEEIHKSLQAKSTEESLATLQTLLKQYPDVKQIYNLLYIAHAKLGQHAQADSILRETLERFPDYLFGRITWAEKCLNRGEFNKIPEIFDNKLELKLLYPERECFHVSEVVSFHGILARYLYARGELAQARRSYDLMRQLRPTHPVTQAVGRILQPSRLGAWLRKIRSQNF